MACHRYLGAWALPLLPSLLSGLGPAEHTLSGGLWSPVYEPLQQKAERRRIFTYTHLYFEAKKARLHFSFLITMLLTKKKGLASKCHKEEVSKEAGESAASALGDRIHCYFWLLDKVA